MDKNPMMIKWQGAILDTYRQVSAQVVEIVPQLLAAVALVVLGWIAAHIAAKGTRSLLTMFASMMSKWIPATASGRETLTPAQIVTGGRVIFWVVMLFFIAAGASTLGSTLFSRLVADVIAYLPKLLIGLLIMLAGYWLSNVSKSIVAAAAISAGITEGKLIGTAVQVAVFSTAFVIGAQQLGIDIQFLTVLFAIVLGVVLAGFSLAFGLGAKQLVANVIGAQHTRKHCKVGDTVTVSNTCGVVVDISATVVVLDTGEGRASIPAAKFMENIILVNGQSDSEL